MKFFLVDTKKPMIEKSFERSFANIIEFSVVAGGYMVKKHSFSVLSHFSDFETVSEIFSISLSFVLCFQQQ